jgi:hypothetical protein
VAPVVWPTPVERRGSGHILTLVGRCDSSHISPLWLHFLTAINIMTLVVYPDSSCRSWRMPYLLICERLHMVELDDYNILQLKHSVRSRSSKCAWLVQHSKPQHLTASHGQVSGHVPRNQWALSLAWSERNPSIQKDLVPPITWVDQWLWMSSQASLGSTSCGHGTKTWSHSGKILWLTNRVRSRFGWSKTSNALWARCMMSTVLSNKLGIARWKNPDYLSGLVITTHMHDDFESLSSRDSRH